MRITELPPSPPDRKGWPWTEPSVEVDDARSNPLTISVVIPSFNQGNFIEETIRSVLLQNWPKTELIIIDGGSRDATVDILRRYNRWISFWVTERDSGQSHAINKGFKRVTGDLVVWQNSDDFFKPGAFASAARASEQFPNMDVFYGNVDVVNAGGTFDHKRTGCEFELKSMLPWLKIYNQSAFFRRRILGKGHRIEERWQHHMDQFFFWDLIHSGWKFKYVPEIESCFRIHPAAKGEKQQDIAAKELGELYDRLLRSDLSPEFKRDVADSLTSLAIDDFGKGRLGLFRNCFHRLISAGAVRAITPGLLGRYGLSWLGVRNLERLRAASARLRSTQGTRTF